MNERITELERQARKLTDDETMYWSFTTPNLDKIREDIFNKHLAKLIADQKEE